MPVVQDLADMYKAVDAAATINLLAKLAVEKSYHAKLDDTRSSLAVGSYHHNFTDIVLQQVSMSTNELLLCWVCGEKVTWDGVVSGIAVKSRNSRRQYGTAVLVVHGGIMCHTNIVPCHLSGFGTHITACWAQLEARLTD